VHSAAQFIGGGEAFIAQPGVPDSGDEVALQVREVGITG
jgi:hypothetical protein